MSLFNSGLPNTGTNKIRRVLSLSGGTTMIANVVTNGSIAANALVAASPSLTGGVWTDVVVINGAGQINWAAVESASAGMGVGTSGRLLLDGVVVATTTANLPSATNGALLAGAFSLDVANAQSTVAFQSLPFNSQAKIQVKSGNNAVTMNVGVNYEVHAL